MDSMEKGKTAENIVMDLFKEAGFKVYRYGYEHLLPELADRENLLQGRAAQFIRHQPDLVVVNKRNEAFFVEVKFRSNYILAKDIFNYPEGYVVLLTKGWVLAQSTRYIHQKGWNFASLNKMPPFRGISSELLGKYSKIIKRKLGDETWTGQKFENFFEKITGKKFVQPAWPTNALINPDRPKAKRKPIRKKHKGRGNISAQKKRWNAKQKKKKQTKHHSFFKKKGKRD